MASKSPFQPKAFYDLCHWADPPSLSSDHLGSKQVSSHGSHVIAAEAQGGSWRGWCLWTVTPGMELTGTRTNGLIQPCSYSAGKVGDCSALQQPRHNSEETSEQTRKGETKILAGGKGFRECLNKYPCWYFSHSLFNPCSRLAHVSLCLLYCAALLS